MLPEPTRERPNLMEIRRAPEKELECRIGEIWEGVLGIEGVGIDDDFFDLGGDSLSAVRVLTELEQCIGREIPVDNLLRAPTVRRLVAFLDQGKKPVSVVALGPIGKMHVRRPLFCIYGLYLYKYLAEELGTEFPTYGVYIQAETKLIKPEMSRFTSLPGVEKLAELYLQQIRAIQPVGPYQLLGFSFGGLVAFEIAHQLRAANEEVRLLALLDTYAPDSRRPSSLLGWAHHLRRVLQDRWPTLPQPKASSAPGSRVHWDQVRSRIRRRAARAYKARSFTGDALLLRASQAVKLPGYRVDSLLGWGAVVRGSLTVHDVSGDHLDILQPPHVSMLAEKLRRYLDSDEYEAAPN